MIDNPKLIVAVYVLGEHLDPDLVTNAVGVAPSRMQRNGVTYLTESGTEYTAKSGLWVFASPETSSFLDVHLAQLVDALRSAGALNIPAIAGVEDAFVDVFVALVSDSDGDAKCELEISPQTLEGLAALRLPIRISMAAGPE